MNRRLLPVIDFEQYYQELLEIKRMPELINMLPESAYSRGTYYFTDGSKKESSSTDFSKNQGLLYYATRGFNLRVAANRRKYSSILPLFFFQRYVRGANLISPVGG